MGGIRISRKYLGRVLVILEGAPKRAGKLRSCHGIGGSGWKSESKISGGSGPRGSALFSAFWPFIPISGIKLSASSDFSSSSSSSSPLQREKGGENILSPTAAAGPSEIHSRRWRGVALDSIAPNSEIGASPPDFPQKKSRNWGGWGRRRRIWSLWAMRMRMRRIG